MKHIFYIVLAVLTTLAAAHGQTTYEANLDPFQEVPPHNVPGFGFGSFTLSGMVITVSEGSYNDLLAGALTVRLNDAAVGSNGPTVGTLTLDTPGNTNGTFSGSATLTADQVTDLSNGNFYVNITSSVFPSGEIRGQLTAVPEPSSVTLAGLGIVLAAGWRVRRRAIALLR